MGLLPIPLRNAFSSDAEAVTRPWIRFFEAILQELKPKPIEEYTQAELAAVAAKLKAADKGKIVFVKNFWHYLRWTGAGWEFAPGDSGSGYLGLFATPPGPGWEAITGGPILYLKGDGTLGTVNIADMTGYYIKGGAFTGLQVAEVPTGALSGTTAVQSGAGATVASATHTHTKAEPKSMAWTPYLRI